MSTNGNWAMALPRRHTDRLALAAPEPWVELEQQLRAVLDGTGVDLDGTGVDLDVIDNNGRPALADASRRSERHRRRRRRLTNMNCSGGQADPT